MDYCVGTHYERPANQCWNATGMFWYGCGCDTDVSGIMGFGVENVTNYLNYKFYAGEDIFFCIQEPDNIGTDTLDAWTITSYNFPDRNNSFFSFSSDDPSDLKQYKYSDSENWNGVWRYVQGSGWAKNTKYPEEFQFCMKTYAGDTEECYSLGSKAQNQYLSCGDDNVKIGEEFKWYGDDNTEFNQLDLWLYEGTSMGGGSKIKLGVEHIDKDTNITTLMWLGDHHNYSEFNTSLPTIGLRKVTEYIPFTNVTFMEDEYYRVFTICDQCGVGFDGVSGICTASTREETADNYSFLGFQDDTGQYFREEGGVTIYWEYRDMPFLLTMGSGLVWQTIPSQCSDGLDNDGDGWTDYPFDPQCIDANDNNESPYDYDCNDGYDNDGDYYFDYPADPSCTSITDDDESPADTYQCDDGIDNDLDGFTDYPLDPSCNSTTDNDESPADFSEQPEDDCLDSLQCLIYDSIPYADSSFLHGWYGGQESDAKTVTFLGGYSFDLDTVDEEGMFENVIIYKNISHANNYNDLYGEFIFAIFDDYVTPFTDESIYFGFSDNNENPLVWALLNVSQSDTAYDIEAELYFYNTDHWEYSYTLYTDDSENGYLRIEFEIDEANDEFEVQYVDMTGSYDDLTVYGYKQAGNIYMAEVTNQLNSNYSQVLLNLVKLEGSVGVETVCDTWEKPYHLIANFNGYMSQCDWNVDPDLFMFGNVAMTNEVDNFALYKIFDDDSDNALYYDRNRFSTVKFDFTPYADSTSNYVMNLYLYDLALETTLTRIYFQRDGTIEAYVHGENQEIYDGMVMNTTSEVMIILDLIEDTYDFYYGGVLRQSNVGLYNEFYNAEYFNGIYFQSSDSHYFIDNLEVIESDDEGDELPNVEIPTTTPDEDKSWCELFSKVDQSCSSDNDCETGECLVNGKCSKFDFNYCDENSHTRGNKCVLAGMSSCVLTSAGDLILDNFFLFLVFLVIIMGLVYLSIMLRN